MLSTVPVTLFDVLEVRGDKGLSNNEILAILDRGIKPLENLIDNARISSVSNMGLSLDSIYFLPDGSVQLKPLPFEIINEKFVPPECLQQGNVDRKQKLDLCKVYVYAFGAVLCHTLECGTQSTVMPSAELYSLLNLITIRDPSVRLPLPKLAQMTEKLVNTNGVESIEVIKSLFRSIMGSSELAMKMGSEENLVRKTSFNNDAGISDDDNFLISSPDILIDNEKNNLQSNSIFIYNLKRENGGLLFEDYDLNLAPSVPITKDFTKDLPLPTIHIDSVEKDSILEFDGVQLEPDLINNEEFGTKTGHLKNEAVFADNTLAEEISEEKLIHFDNDTDLREEAQKSIADNNESFILEPSSFKNDTLFDNTFQSDFKMAIDSTTDNEMVDGEFNIAETSGDFLTGDISYERLIENNSYLTEGGIEMEQSSSGSTGPEFDIAQKTDQIIEVPVIPAVLIYENETGLTDFTDDMVLPPYNFNSDDNSGHYSDETINTGHEISPDKIQPDSHISESVPYFDLTAETTMEHEEKFNAFGESIASDSEVKLSFEGGCKTLDNDPVKILSAGDFLSVDTSLSIPVTVGTLQKDKDGLQEDDVFATKEIHIDYTGAQIAKNDDSFDLVTNPFADDFNDQIAGKLSSTLLVDSSDEGMEKAVFSNRQNWFDFDSYDAPETNVIPNLDFESNGVVSTADPFLDKAYFDGENAARPSPDSPFDIMDVFSTPRNDVEANRKVFSEYTKSQHVLERLMPMIPTEFTHPKEHNGRGTIRIYHSLDCLYCYPFNDRPFSDTIKTCRSSPSLIFDESIDNGVVVESNKRSRDETSAIFEPFVQKRSADRLTQSPILPTAVAELQRKRSTNDTLFASFDNLPSAGMDQKNAPWHTVKTEVEKGARRETETESDSDEQEVEHEDFSNKIETVGNTPKSYSMLDDIDDIIEMPITDEFPVETNEPVLLNTIEESEDEESTKTVQEQEQKRRPPEHRLSTPTTELPPPKVELFHKKEEPSKIQGNGVSDFGAPNLGGRLSRENSMRIKTGSVRNRQHSFRKQEQRNGKDNTGTIDQTLAKPLTLAKSEQINGRNGTTYSNNLPHILPASKKMNVSDYYPIVKGRGPEFLYNSRQPSIRLKAPTAQRPKRLFRHLMEKNVLVILLNGQRVDVACRTDSTAENIFESVSVHMNLNERHFFGLSVLKDGEHFFLEPEQKIEKFAPHGWRNTSRHVYNARIIFTLFLRVKYYPITLDFVKTEQTLHHIFLQLRRDILDERLRCDKETSCRLAALALQVEFGDKNSENVEHFSLNHYLPDRHFADDIGGEEHIKRSIVILWEHCLGTDRRECKIEYVKVCQSLREYGIHFHRLYRSKPSLLLTPSPLGDPDTGTSLWIGIMPRGVIVFEERRGERVPISQHPWHLTATLQFDHKRFIIFPQTDDLAAPPKYVYYSDDYKKSMYFVNFAAGQHKFCMKMRTWASTLPVAEKSYESGQNSLLRSHSSARREDVSNAITETDSGNSREISPGDNGTVGSVKMRRQHQERAVDAAIVPAYSTPTIDRKSVQAAHISLLSADASLINSLSETMTTSLNERMDNAAVPAPSYSAADFETFTVTLVKDPHFGLGLTLVDGELQNMKGVYVRAITPGGPAELEGHLQIADRIVSINGESLEGRSRHDAVAMVRGSISQVHLGILRLPQRLEAPTNGRHTSAGGGNRSSSGHHSPLPPPRQMTSSSNRFSKMSASSSADVFKGEKESIGESDILKHMNSAATLSHEQELESSVWLNDNSLAGGVSFHAATLASTSDSQMYSGLQSDSEDQSNSDEDSRSHQPQGKSNLKKLKKEKPRPSHANSENSLLRDRLNKDWTDDIQLDKRNIGWKSDDLDLISVTLEKNVAGTLGIQVAGGKGQKKVYIKSLVAEPAISCKRILPGDHLATVNETSTRGLNHHEVVNLLKTAKSPVHLGLLRARNSQPKKADFSRNVEDDATASTASSERQETETETFEILLEKPASGSLGLSLAKSPNSEGIFIRVISPNSVAAIDGRLKVGDRLWKVNGDSVATSSPTEVVEKLKAAQGFVNLVVKREIKKEETNTVS